MGEFGYLFLLFWLLKVINGFSKNQVKLGQEEQLLAKLQDQMLLRWNA